ncbi:MAG: hypothetical protein V1727_05675 [Candidatus Omnitrophota bacterium]
MQKGVLLLLLVALLLSLGIRQVIGQQEDGEGFSSQQVMSKLDAVMASQQEILKKLDEIKQDLAVIQVRATKR